MRSTGEKAMSSRVPWLTKMNRIQVRIKLLPQGEPEPDAPLSEIHIFASSNSQQSFIRDFVKAEACMTGRELSCQM